MSLTIPISTRRVRYTAAGGETSFTYGWPVLVATELRVLRLRAGVIAELALTTDYTVTGVGQQAGGNVVLAAAAVAGDIYAIDGALRRERLTDLVPGGRLNADDIDLELNRLQIGQQELARDLARALAIGPTDDPAVPLALPAKADRASKWLAFDAAGAPIPLAAPSAKGVQPRGGWLTGTAYAVDDVVHLNGVAYIATAAHNSGASTQPALGASWASVWAVFLPASINPRGAWATATAYAVGDTVSQSGSSFICFLPHTSGASTQPGIGASWQTTWQTLLGSAAVLSVFGRTGNVTATAGDYAASQVTNDSTAPGATAKDALDGLKGRLDTLISTVSASYDTLPEIAAAITAILAANWVTTTRIADGAVTLAKLAADSVDAGKIVDGSVGTTELAANAVTNAKLAPMATSRIKGRITASTGDAEDLTAAQATSILDVFTVGAKGLMPAPTASDVTNNRVARADGTWANQAGGGGGTVLPATAHGRLTATSGAAVMTAAVSGASTIYYTPYKGGYIALYNGTSTWALLAFAETGLTLTGLTGNKLYDVFGYNNAGSLALEVLAWTNDTTRATALVRQNGVLVKSGATTRRYLGTFRTNGTGVIDWTMGGASAGATAAKLSIFNCDNRVLQRAFVGDTADSWTYASAAYRQANANTNMQVSFVAGLQEDAFLATYACYLTSGSAFGAIGIGLDSSTAVTGRPAAGPSGVTQTPTAMAMEIPAAGWHDVRALEYSAGGTLTCYGDAGSAALQFGLNFSMMM